MISSTFSPRPSSKLILVLPKWLASVAAAVDVAGVVVVAAVEVTDVVAECLAVTTPLSETAAGRAIPLPMLTDPGRTEMT